MASASKNNFTLSALGYRTIQELETDQGILASGKTEIFGCLFGRDSLITSLKLLKTYEKSRDPYLLALVRKILLNLAALQGKTVNIENGEEPGKCIHEFRPTGHEHLTKDAVQPWYLFPDNSMRNYDSVDATSLFLLAAYEYYAASKEEIFLREILPAVHAALKWILEYGDSNGDGFIDYRFHPDRTFGGLRTQSWMDSVESVFHEDGRPAPYPIAPVEVQAYTYAALRSWARHFALTDLHLGRQLLLKTARLKRDFNAQFVLRHEDGSVSLAFALDGHGEPLVAPRSSMSHTLWAVSRNMAGKPESILAAEHIPQIVARLMAPDLLEPRAGIRTLSANSSKFDPQSYHNGSIWPHDTAILIEGLKNFKYFAEAIKVRKALLRAYAHFQTPIELFVYANGRFRQYRSASGQRGCKKQAWSAAALLAESYE